MIDTHCHLCDKRFEADRSAVIGRAFAAGVSQLIEIGESPAGWADALRLCREYKDIYCAIGVHPNNAGEFTDFSELLKNEKVVAVGECGLDYHWDAVPRKKQQEIFVTQLEIAQTFDKPVSIHCRSAESDLYDIIKTSGLLRGVIHCFSSDNYYAKKFLDLGLYIGIDGPVTFPNAGRLRDAVKNIPPDRILLETDCPYLAPQQHRGRRNEPAFLTHIAEKIAEITGIPFARVAAVTDENARLLFGI